MRPGCADSVGDSSSSSVLPKPSELSRFAATDARSCGAATNAPIPTAMARSATRRHDRCRNVIAAAHRMATKTSW